MKVSDFIKWFSKFPPDSEVLADCEGDYCDPFHLAVFPAGSVISENRYYRYTEPETARLWDNEINNIV